MPKEDLKHIVSGMNQTQQEFYQDEIKRLNEELAMLEYIKEHLHVNNTLGCIEFVTLSKSTFEKVKEYLNK